jgi:hypothetical protein
LFRYPGHEHESEFKDLDEKSIDWDYFITELNRESGGQFSSSPASPMLRASDELKTSYESVGGRSLAFRRSQEGD